MCVLAGACERASGWLTELRVGAEAVRVGLSARGRVRFVIDASG